MKASYQKLERSLRLIIALLLVQFVLGVLLTTVINYQPHHFSAIQSIILVLHIANAIALLILAIIHIKASRSTDHLLGFNPIRGLMFIITAIIAGSFASSDSNSWAILIMALAFGGAITVYGLSYIKVKSS